MREAGFALFVVQIDLDVAKIFSERSQQGW
jgi:hypothetical protein